MIVIDVFGEPTVVARGETKLLKLEDRLRAELTFKMPRRSTVTVELGNGAQLRVGSDSEVTVEEFWQQPHSKSGKMAEWKEEPSGSRTLVRLDRGDLAVKVKPLQVARGSSFTVELIAGALRITAGEVRARVQMTELGLGLCTLHLLQGAAELEAAGGKVILLKPGERLSLPIEVDARGNVKVGEMPKAETAKRKE